MGLTYAFLYMGRYNLTVSKNALGDLMTKEDFGIIFAAGTFTYAFAFLINGPLTDKIGGKRAILIGAAGSAVANLAMGLYISTMTGGAICETAPHLRVVFSVLYAINMYFQSYGAVAIVKVNSHWFHVRERGGFSGIFGTMISSGIFLAFTVNDWVLTAFGGAKPTFSDTKWVFFVPAALLATFFVIELFLLRDRPALAGLEDFDTGDASSGETGDVPVTQIIKRILTHPIILTVAFIEFCTGVLRNGVMHWYPIYAKEVLALPSGHALRSGSWSAWYVIVAVFALAGITLFAAAKSKGKAKGWLFVSGGLLFLAPFMQAGWGGILMVAGVIGGNVAGWMSDLFFQSRRAPTAGLLYVGLSAASIGMFFTLGTTTSEVAWSKSQQTPGFETLQAGDQLVSVAGQPVNNWEQIGKAVACLPSKCECDSQWDTKNCTCASKPEVTATNLPVSDGGIAAVIVRNGEQRQIRLRDPKWNSDNPEQGMYAGDKRSLAAGPVLPLSPFWLGAIVFLISLCVIGTHGLLSGTATMDFGGSKGAATAVGMIDGFVYLGTAVQSLALGYLTTHVGWYAWPIFLFPFGIIGLLLLVKIWKVVPKGKGGH
ncbi:MAG: hypothetical protein A2341_12955 [Deltaproteobacteria bacterium RIFOXYB12_FULL_58_9]|nr:MAG: hypothetical protein A2341_12955 [Deltaproteobacteria bacterium RIFOXYB12_FULL_58_9]